MRGLGGCCGHSGRARNGTGQTRALGGGRRGHGGQGHQDVVEVLRFALQFFGTFAMLVTLLLQGYKCKTLKITS